MIYLSKLAKRLALAGPQLGLLLSLLAFAGSCASPEEREFLSPNPTQPIPITSLEIEPKIGSARPGEVIQFSATARNAKGAVAIAEVDWTATGGSSISPTGTFVSEVFGQFQVTARVRANPVIADSARVGVFVDPRDILKLSITPDGMEITEGEGLQLEATAELADGSVVLQPALAWSADIGQVDGSGYFIAPEAEGQFAVLARAASGVTGAATVSVKRISRNLERVQVSPGSATLVPGETQQFTGVGVWESGLEKAVSLVWSSTGGTISTDGLFTAGSTPGNFRVIARYAQGTLADTSFVSITEPGIVGLEVAPGNTELAPGATQQYVATALLSDGTAKSVGATWEATGGTINSAGLYSASTSGSWTVRAEVPGTSFSTETEVTVSAPASTLVSLVLTPSSVNVAQGAGRQFTVTAAWSNGSTQIPPITWSATGGSISVSGYYTAGNTMGPYQVIASAGGKADTSAGQITAALLISMSVTPSAVTLPPGATQQFTVSGTWTNGSTNPPATAWSTNGGTITSAGLFTAGSAAGTFRVIGSHASGKADTSLVTVAPSAPVLVSVSLTPSAVSLAPGGSRQFSVSGSWTGGGTGAPPVTYTATGGTVTTNGLYQAGASAGTFRVIARHTDGTLADTSSVVISAAAPTLVSLAVSPKTTSLQTGGSRQFTASATWSDGSTAVPGVTWTATGGTVSSAGLYVAPASAGTYKVVGREAGGTKADTATVTVTAPAVVVGLAVSPGTKSLATGGQQQFSALATYSNGGTGTPALAWTATGGSISSGGLYTGASAAGNYRVMAQASGTSVKDTAEVTLTSLATPTVTGLVLSPGSTTLNPGGTAQFSVAPTWSDGATRSVTPSYSATGGTITSAGLFTAGQTAGTFRVIAGCTGCTVADTSQVTIQTSGGSSTVSSVTISPRTITLDIGEVYQFTSIAQLTNGTTQANPTVTWSAISGGMVSSGGLYRAPSAAGTYTLRITHEGGAVDNATITVVVPTGPYFSDNFNSCTLNKTANAQGFMWRDTGGGTTAERPAVTSTFGRSGCSLKFTFVGGPAGDDSWSEQRFRLGKKLSEVYMQWYQYFPTGAESPSLGPKFAHRDDTGPDNNKFLRLWDDEYSGYRVKLGFSTLPNPGGDSRMITEWGTNGKGVGVQGAQTNPSGITDARRGTWVQIRVHVRLATPANNDGIVEMWMDGVKILTNTTLALYPTNGSGNYMLNGYLMGWANSGFTLTSQTFIDDVVISATPMP